jgi:hypothetical protein
VASSSALDAQQVHNFREPLEDGSSNCSLCHSHITSAWSTHANLKCHLLKEAVAKSDQGAFCTMRKCWQVACKACPAAGEFNVNLWDVHAQSAEHVAAAAGGVPAVVAVDDPMEFIVATSDPAKIRCTLCLCDMAVKTAKVHSKAGTAHALKKAIAKSAEAAHCEMLHKSNVRCKLCRLALTANEWADHKATAGHQASAAAAQ